MVVVLTAPLGADDLAQLKFLIGRWQAIDTAAGESGSFTFELAVQDHVMLRRNEAIYEATNRRPSSRHNEGHVIRYSVQPRGGNRVVFLSDAKTSEPRYRLSYSIGADGALTGTFEVAAPGSGDAFNPYLSWRARRR